MTETQNALNTPSIDLDLDSIEQEKNRPGPYFVAWKDGRVVEMVDPEELDWQDTIGVNDPISLLKVAIAEKDRSYVEETSLPGFKLRAVFDGYMKHFGLPGDQGKQRSGLLT